MTLLVIGLGNPGSKYHGTRHNTGFDVVDKLASKFGVKFSKPFFKKYFITHITYNSNKFILVKPTTYMNRSGEVLPSLLSKYKLTNSSVVIVVDNLDIEKGLLKFKLKGSDGGHNGLKSINDYLGSNEYKRLFVGIGRPPKGESITEYVLSPIEDNEVLEAEDRAVEGLLRLTSDSISQVMNYINRRKIDK
ncbi:aminoacyl-tRNA hydrolase [Thiospirochaeta perfilievii]|uniref:Peptidyl-tRNA hydrolase n=1 Tax=Thiospirochaeta perfilievii TaxID=252967 RepID=A0A5C1QFC4_9SPIO|nr:aminoacyl-tRNA hydrolase [Thiospirochaeta perfilievii]QEN06221.1 aminoacyl-tRNA hydrolase [Thiospirochaeta perfilievii]